jgi:serine/threonine-protein kinase HipA
MNDRWFQFFLQFHHGIPRQGPGTAAATTDAFRRIERLLPPSPTILDLGCGSGGQTLTLAELTSGTFLAIDIYPAFIEELQRRLAERALLDRVTAQVGDMKALGLPAESFDLIWCEGAMFALGFQPGLRTLRPLLRGPGLVVVSELTWLQPLEEIPREVREFFAETCPAMTDVAGNLALAHQAGFTPLEHFKLPDEGWSAYVDPLERRMNDVLAEHPADPDAEVAATRARREAAMFRRNLRYFGYEFFLLQRS